MPIEAPSGTLDIENAKLRVSEISATTSVGIGTENAQKYPIYIYKATEPELLIQEGTSTAAKFTSKNGCLVIQSGVAPTDSSAGDIGFSTMGDMTRHVTILGTNGNVGIGVTNPGVKLHIQSSSGELFRYTDGTRTVYGGCDTNQPWLGTSTNHDLRLFTNSSEKVRISSGGNVGIGVTNPLDKLHVKDGSISFSQGYRISGRRADNTEAGYIISNSEGWTIGENRGSFTSEIQIGESGLYFNCGGERMRITSDGNVGIGTTSPGNSRVAIYNNGTDANSVSSLGLELAAPWIRIGDGIGARTMSNGSGIKFHDTGVAHYSVGQKDGKFRIASTSIQGDQLFPSGYTEGIVMTTAGDVGIGVTNPSTKLHVKGGNLKIENDGSDNIDNKLIFAETGYNDRFFIGTDLSGVQANLQHLRIGFTTAGDSGITNSNVIMNISGSGNVGIGKTNPAYTLDVNGTLNTNGNPVLITWTNSTRATDPPVGTFGFNTDTNIFEVFKSTGWYNVITGTTLMDGSSPSLYATSATQLLTDFPSSTDGLYYYKIPGTSTIKGLYTDMTRDGGGWVIISKWGGHSKTAQDLFTTLEVDLATLQTGTFGGYGDRARLSRDHMNAIWPYSKFVTRIHFKYDASVSGVYFQSKLTNRSTFDLWKGHYSPLYWSDFNNNGVDRTAGGGTYYEVTFAQALTDPTLANYSGSSYFITSTNSISGGSGEDGNMGFWDRVTQTTGTEITGGFEIARHLGFFGDISSGNQWLLTANSGDSRWSVNENRVSMIFLRW